MPRRVLFVSYTASLGGAERLLLQQAGAVEGSAAVACPPGPLAAAARGLGHAVWPLRARRLELRGGTRNRLAAPMRLAAQSLEVRRAISELSPACVVGWSMRGLLVAAGAQAGSSERAPLVFQHNDLLPSPVVGKLVRRAARRAEVVVAASNAVARDLDPAGEMAVQVIHPGVDLDRFAASPLPTGPGSVLVLGALVRWKRPEFALEVAALARRKLPQLTVSIGGAPLDASGRRIQRQLEDRAAAPDLAGAVSLLGAVDDVPTALAGATCLLHCAEREPFGMVLAEALAAGRPVVAPRANGAREVVDETCGRLYEPGDSHAAAAALVEGVIGADELTGPARERAERLFDARDSRDRFRTLLAGLR